MIVAIAAILVVGFITVAAVGITEARSGIKHLEDDGDFGLCNFRNTFESSYPARWVPAVTTVDALEANRFTSSLLSLGKAQTQGRHDSPGLVHDESSSLVLVPLTQSKNRAQEL